MTPGADSGRLPAAYLVPGSSSFTEFLSAQAPDLLPRAAPCRRAPRSTRRTARRSCRSPTRAASSWAATAAPHGQPHLQPGHREGLPADSYSVVGIAGAAGIAIEMVRLYQVELEHYEKIEGLTLSLDGKANRLAAMIRGNLGAAMQGLAVVPLFAGFYDAAAGTRPHLQLRRHRRELRGAWLRHRRLRLPLRQELAEEATWRSRLRPKPRPAPSGGGPVRRRRRRLRHRRPRPGRRLYPIVCRVDAEGAARPDAEVAAVADGIVTDRAEADNPGGAQ